MIKAVERRRLTTSRAKFRCDRQEPTASSLCPSFVGRPSVDGSVSSATSCPLIASIVSAVMPVAAEAEEKPSSLSGRSGKLRTKTVWNYGHERSQSRCPMLEWMVCITPRVEFLTSLMLLSETLNLSAWSSFVGVPCVWNLGSVSLLSPYQNELMEMRAKTAKAKKMNRAARFMMGRDGAPSPSKHQTCTCTAGTDSLHRRHTWRSCQHGEASGREYPRKEARD